MVNSNPIAAFDKFVQASDCQEIRETFTNLCDLVDVSPLDEGWFYDSLKSKLTHWKAKSLWTKLDKRFSQKVYENHKSSTRTRVLIIGAGPCGLRAAIECKLLGAKTVVIEKRDRFSRNNVLHLWSFLITDLKSLGAKMFFPKFCAGSLDHISIRQLQCILMKIALMLGVEIHTLVSFVKILEPDAENGWKSEVLPVNHPVSYYEFDVLIGADGKKNTLSGFTRQEFRGKLAIAITANFVNHWTQEESRVEEISGVAFIFNQQFFKDLNAKTSIDLENIVYYKDDTHYFVMTAKKASLIKKGVLLQDDRDAVRLLAPDNIDQQKLQEYAIEAADFSTNHKLPNLKFASNHYGQADVSVFDFTSIHAANYSCMVKERKGRKLLTCIVGDSLLEPFWPTGSGCARGFLGVFDSCWAIKKWSSLRIPVLNVISERESVYQLLSQSTPDNMNPHFHSYTIDPVTRYKHVNVNSVKPFQVRHLYDTDVVGEITPDLINNQQEVITNNKTKRAYDALLDTDRLLRWCVQRLCILPENIRPNTDQITDLTSCWADGRLLVLLLHLHRPDLISLETLDKLQTPIDRFTVALNVATEHLGVIPLMSPEEHVTTECSDLLYMAGLMSQIHGTLRKHKTPGAAPEFLEKSRKSPAPAAAELMSPASRKRSRKSSAGKLGFGKAVRKRKSSFNPNQNKKSQKSPKSPKSPKAALSPRDKQSYKGATESLVRDRSLLKTKMNRIKDAFTFNKQPAKQDKPPPQKPKLKKLDSWKKEDNFSEHDRRMKILTSKIEKGNLGNIDPGVRGSNMVSSVTNKFERQLSDSGQPEMIKSPDEPNKSSLETLLSREPRPNEICCFCRQRIYLTEHQSAEGKHFHSKCFRCHICSIQLHTGTYMYSRSVTGVGNFYCSLHVGQEKKTSDISNNRTSILQQPLSNFSSPKNQSLNDNLPESQSQESIQKTEQSEIDISNIDTSNVNMRKRKQKSAVTEQPAERPRLSILKQPVVISPPESTNQNLEPVDGDSETAITPSSPSPSNELSSVSVRAALNRRSNFFSEMPEPVRLNPRLSLTQTPADEIEVKKDDGSDMDTGPESGDDNSQMEGDKSEHTETDRFDNVEITRSTQNLKTNQTEQHNYLQDTLRRAHSKSSQRANKNRDKRESTNGAALLNEPANQTDQPHPPNNRKFELLPLQITTDDILYDDIDQSESSTISDQSDIEDEFFTDQSDEDDLSGVSTPNEDELALIGTLGYDGILHNTPPSRPGSEGDNLRLSTPEGECKASSTSIPRISITNPTYSDEVIPAHPVVSSPYINQSIRSQHGNEWEEPDHIYETINSSALRNITPRSKRRAKKGAKNAARSPEKLRKKISVDLSLADFNEWDSDTDLGVVSTTSSLCHSFSQSCGVTVNEKAAVASDEDWISDISDVDSSDDEGMVDHPGDNTLIKSHRAALRQQKLEENKRLHMAQELQRQLEEVEVKTQSLETEGRDIEFQIRQSGESTPNSISKTKTNDLGANHGLIQRWFNIVHEKSLLLRYQTELHTRARELELEDRHTRLSNELRGLMTTPETERTENYVDEENSLIQQIVEAVEQRNQLVDLIEADRQKELLEDEQLQEIMSSKGFQLSPAIYNTLSAKRRITVKQAHKPSPHL